MSAVDVPKSSDMMAEKLDLKFNKYNYGSNSAPDEADIEIIRHQLKKNLWNYNLQIVN